MSGISKWLKIGKKNFWIRQAWDPPFTKNSFYFCQDAEELKGKFISGNWCLGQAFVLGNLCFINQVNGGDEWLTIKDDCVFESISWQVVIKNGEFENLLSRLQSATLEACKKLEY